MSEAKHTPGPWVFTCGHGKHHSYFVGPLTERDGRSVVSGVAEVRRPCDCCEPGDGFEADVRLMAAAPAVVTAGKLLLAALEGWLSARGPLGKTALRQMAILEAEIRKAEGGEG